MVAIYGKPISFQEVIIFDKMFKVAFNWNYLFRFHTNMAGQTMHHRSLGCNKWVHVILFYDNEELESELYVDLKVYCFVFINICDLNRQITVSIFHSV